MSKTCKNVDFGGSPGKCQKHVQNYKKCQTGPTNAILRPHNNICQFFLKFSGGSEIDASRTPFDILFWLYSTFSGTLPNWHFDICVDIFQGIQENPCYTRAVRLRVYQATLLRNGCDNVSLSPHLSQQPGCEHMLSRFCRQKEISKTTFPETSKKQAGFRLK